MQLPNAPQTGWYTACTDLCASVRPFIYDFYNFAKTVFLKLRDKYRNITHYGQIMLN